MASAPETPKTLTSPPAELSAEERRNRYNRAVRQSRLVAILLSDLKFNIDREKQAAADRLQPRYSGALVNFAYDDETGVCAAGVQWTVDVLSGRKKVARCKATYDVIYDGLDNFEEEVIRIFADNTAQATSYSYFRSLFATLDWASELRLPPLPAIKFVPKV